MILNEKNNMEFFFLNILYYLQHRADNEELRSLHSSAILTTEMSGTKIESLQRSGLDKISLAKTSKAYSTSSDMEAEVSRYKMLCRLANSMASALSTSLLSSRSSLLPRMIVTGS